MSTVATENAVETHSLDGRLLEALSDELVNRPSTEEIRNPNLRAELESTEQEGRNWGRAVALAGHWGIIVWFGMQCFYAGFQVFVTMGSGPLFFRALDMPHEMMVTRRLYALEGWVAMGALAIYLAITEIGPRLAAERALKA